MKKLKAVEIDVSNPATKEVIVLFRKGSTHYFDDETGSCYCGAVYKEDAAETECPVRAAIPSMIRKLQAAEEMAKALKAAANRFHAYAGRFKNLGELCDSRNAWQDMKDTRAALSLWDKAGKGTEKN